MTSHLTPTVLLPARTSLAAALDGSGPPVEFTEDGRTVTRPEASDAAADSAPGVAAVVRTSGSTGTPKQTLLTGKALAASSTATAARLGGWEAGRRGRRGAEAPSSGRGSGRGIGWSTHPSPVNLK